MAPPAGPIPSSVRGSDLRGLRGILKKPRARFLGTQLFGNKGE